MRVSTAQELRTHDPDVAGWLDLVPGYDPWLQMQEGWYFDAGIARAAVEWFPANLTLMKGPKAGTPFVLEPFQAAIIAMLWGFRRESGLRRFRRAWLYVGKKNAKSTLAAGIVALVMATDGEEGAEIYSVAAGQKQTAHVFDHTAYFIRKNPELKARFRIYGDKGGTVAKSIVDRATMSSYKCMASDAKTIDGVNPHLSIIDELHRHKSGELSDVLLRSSRTRTQPLTIWTTTADTNRDSACNTLLKFARAVRDNPGDEGAPGYAPDFAPFIWEAAAEDDWEDPATWAKANPGLGTIKPMEAMAEACADAKSMPSTLNSFLRLDLNIVTDTDEAWLDPVKWDACSPVLTAEDHVEWFAAKRAELAGASCYMGIDLSLTTDQTAVVLWFPESKTLLPWFWIPDEAARTHEKKYGVPYSLWGSLGLIEIVPGGVIEFDQIRDTIILLWSEFDVKEGGFDPWNGEQLRQDLVPHGIDLVKMTQGARTMHEPCKAFERMVIQGALDHGGNPILRMNARNVSTRTDANGNIIYAKKTKSGTKTGPIDGVAAGCMAVGCAIYEPEVVDLEALLLATSAADWQI